ncbi:hypothetical protein RRG08_024931 [Elysia crispata]|uniref:Uncharacterized protein n=1 Tax=Elysia crispata TaxID=231223 RepID=A0AAE1D9X4_9GAST|nr:hypothetical protein RRG08_024931 [Elysia crispata]
MKTKRVSSCAPGRITIQFVYENKTKDVIELCVKAAIYVADLAIMSMEKFGLPRARKLRLSLRKTFHSGARPQLPTRNEKRVNTRWTFKRHTALEIAKSLISKRMFNSPPPYSGPQGAADGSYHPPPPPNYESMEGYNHPGASGRGYAPPDIINNLLT